MRRRLNTAFRQLPIRTKLTLGFAAAMAVMLAAIGVFVNQTVVRGLDKGIDQGLQDRAAQIVSLVQGPRHMPLDQLRLGGGGDDYAQILSTQGSVLDTSGALDFSLLRPADVARARRGPIFTGTHEVSRVFATPADHGALIVVTGQSLADHEDAVESLTAALVISGPVALVLASLAGYALAAAALRPVESMRRRAATISAGDTSAKLPLPDSVDEIYRLGSTLNEMLARLEQAFEHERAFVADASHELRSPLTVLKAELEVALAEHPTPGPTRQALESAVEEVDRVIALAEDLLVLAGADRSDIPLRLDSLRTEELLDAVGEQYRPTVLRAGRELVVDRHDGAFISADPTRLRQALANLVDNALQYGSGAICIRTHTRDGLVEVHVTDEGPGFPPEFLATAFERFSRADRARGRGGSGLGLAIVDAIARAHGGEAHAGNRPGGGADVWLVLPAPGRSTGSGQVTGSAPAPETLSS